MSIRGTAIVTPAGSETRGDYGRHSFQYTVPAGDPGAGATLFMVLVDEDTIHLTKDANSATQPAPQIWHRCPADVS